MAFPENPAAINASHNDALNLALKYKIEGQKEDLPDSEAARIDEQMRGLLDGRQRKVGHGAMFGVTGSTIRDKAEGHSLRV
tara:strand:- start:48 stop:290 length:243 start_codon:yes stop_codon:yes gene_type:complete